jgi:hypothetical protein
LRSEASLHVEVILFNNSQHCGKLFNFIFRKIISKTVSDYFGSHIIFFKILSISTNTKLSFSETFFLNIKVQNELWLAFLIHLQLEHIVTSQFGVDLSTLSNSYYDERQKRHFVQNQRWSHDGVYIYLSEVVHQSHKHIDGQNQKNLILHHLLSVSLKLQTQKTK